ncbi:hypothetical protein GCM10007921_09540 [Tritonibacter mobilis]|uniref:hypothetical protein n=1 Tax=Tritonibacter mobilis TaxID=379347 RepID=UPI000806E1E5|nr:hypothetical protein [Tritonibacter mobilis]GLP85394.1 hypothetical protein GCM10007921_09540 [Tritonibacter mobilis]
MEFEDHASETVNSRKGTLKVTLRYFDVAATMVLSKTEAMQIAATNFWIRQQVVEHMPVYLKETDAARSYAHRRHCATSVKPAPARR